MNRLWFTFLIFLITSPLWAAGTLCGNACKATWNANTETDLAGYKMYLGVQPSNYSIVKDVGKTLTPASPLVAISTLGLADGQWYLAVTAYDVVGNEGGKSLEAPFLLDRQAPVGVGGVRVE